MRKMIMAFLMEMVRFQFALVRLTIKLMEFVECA